MGASEKHETAKVDRFANDVGVKSNNNIVMLQRH